MHLSRAVVITLVVLAVVGLAAAACSSSAKSDADINKGLVVFFTPGQGSAPTIPAKYASCVDAKLDSADRAAAAKLTNAAALAKIDDALGVRLIRAGHACDNTLTQQLVEAQIFSGAPNTISAAQKSCATTKAIAALSALDDSKLTGTNTSAVSDAAQNALKACGVSVPG